ncbi:hypothetical protein C5167_008450 [Papaver somniferum]|uniref:Uncharacterized protein n=1 Tax=Papaver somniferum TaxID=3469 RepID=A0A4Y7JVN4_PAPSO|nr:hypothetical protein C5167_008450 [Papaver somniferum]
MLKMLVVAVKCLDKNEVNVGAGSEVRGQNEDNVGAIGEVNSYKDKYQWAQNLIEKLRTTDSVLLEDNL